MMRLFSGLFFSVIICACSNETENNELIETNQPIIDSPKEEIPVDTSSVVSPIADVYHSETFETTGQKGWGYRIMLNGELYINQPHIPAIQGNKGFSNPVFAKKTADYAILKIEQGIIPPTLTVEELDSLGVLN